MAQNVHIERARALVGRQVALRNPATNRWLRVTGDGGADSVSQGDWNDGWGWERFEVKAVGVGIVALKNLNTNRWLRVTAEGRADSPAQGDWNDSWGWERFEVRDVGGGQIALRNPATNRWLRVTGDGGVDSLSQGDWNVGWEWERFEVRELAGPRMDDGCGGGGTRGASSSRGRDAPHVSQYERLSALRTAKETCRERGCELAGVLMEGVWENLRDMMCSEHRSAMQSRSEGDGRNHWCQRFCREGEYKDTEVIKLRHESLLEYDIFVSREHAYAPKKRKHDRVEWPVTRRNRADACIWLRRRSSPRLGLEPPTLLWHRAALDAELELGGLQCALVLEFKYAVASHPPLYALPPLPPAPTPVSQGTV